MRVLADVVLAIHDCPVPVVAKVDGLCVGAGLGLALAADLTWCADRARFSAIFAKRGLSLDFGTSWLLRQRIGVHKAKELAFTAKMLSGTEAFELGLVNAVVPAAELDDATSAIVETIAAGPPIALSATKRELDNASTSSLAQAPRDGGARAELQCEHRRHARGARRVHGTPPGNVHGPVGHRMAAPDNSGDWGEVLDDLQRRRDASRDGRRRTAAQAPRRREARRSRAHRPSPRPRVVPGARHARRRRGRTRRRRRDGFGPHRRTPGDGRRRGLHGEGRHHQRGGELQALPGGRARGHRPRAVDHDAGGRRFPGRRARSRRADTHRHARPGPVLRPGAARHGRPRPVGRPRRAGRADVGLHRDESARRDLHGRPARRARVTRRDGHQGRPRRPGGRARQRSRPQRRRERRRRPRPRAQLPRLLPVVGLVVPARHRRRRRAATRPGDPRHRPAQRSAHLRHAQGDRRRLRRRLVLRGATRLRPAGHLRALPPRRAPGRRRGEPTA